MAETGCCVYCGAIATTVDHVVPRHLVKRAGELNLDLSSLFRIRDWELPACRECNCALGGKIFRTLRERREWVKKWLKKRYRNLLEMPNWSEEEIAEMGPNMQREIRKGLRNRAIVRERVKFEGSAPYAEDLCPVYELLAGIVGQAANKKPTGNAA